MSISRREVLRIAAAGVWLPHAVVAQPSRQQLVGAMIGAAGPDDPAGIEWEGAIRQGLAEQSWIDGQNMRIEARFTAGDPNLIAQYAAELVSIGPDVFVAGTSLNALAVRALDQATPLVFVAATDPVAEGLVTQIARPGETRLASRISNPPKAESLSSSWWRLPRIFLASLA